MARLGPSWIRFGRTRSEAFIDVQRSGARERFPDGQLSEIMFVEQRFKCRVPHEIKRSGLTFCCMR